MATLCSTLFLRRSLGFRNKACFHRLCRGSWEGGKLILRETTRSCGPSLWKCPISASATLAGFRPREVTEGLKRGACIGVCARACESMLDSLGFLQHSSRIQH